MHKCKKCDEWVYEKINPNHKCPPIWLIWDEDETEEDSVGYYGSDAGDAVEKWATENDCGNDHYILNSRDGIIVYVKGENGEIAKYRVSGEATVVYSATLE